MTRTLVRAGVINMKQHSPYRIRIEMVVGDELDAGGKEEGRL